MVQIGWIMMERMHISHHVNEGCRLIMMKGMGLIMIDAICTLTIMIDPQSMPP